MLSKIARGAFLLLMTGMIVAWALQTAMSATPQLDTEQAVWIVFA
jgi:hypothetical protein